MRIAMAQFDFVVGAPRANADRIAALAAEARDVHGARLCLFPELAISGYLVTVAETVGEEWLVPHLFRFGASSLLNDVLLQRQKMATGHYSGPDYVTID